MEVFHEPTRCRSRCVISQVDLSNARPDVVSEPPTCRTEEEPEFELQELLDYMPVHRGPDDAACPVSAGRPSPAAALLPGRGESVSVEPFWLQIEESELRQGDYLPGCTIPVFGPAFTVSERAARDQNRSGRPDYCHAELRPGAAKGEAGGRLPHLSSRRIRGRQSRLRPKGTME